MVSEILNNGSSLDLNVLQWTRKPKSCTISSDTISIVTNPGTDLWQRTYYHFRNDNAPVLQMSTREPYSSFVVKTDFQESHQRFDQCGVVMYLDSESRCGTVSAAALMISASSVLPTESLGARCVSATCMRPRMRCDSPTSSSVSEC